MFMSHYVTISEREGQSSRPVKKKKKRRELFSRRIIDKQSTGIRFAFPTRKRETIRDLYGDGTRKLQHAEAERSRHGVFH